MPLTLLHLEGTFIKTDDTTPGVASVTAVLNQLLFNSGSGKIVQPDPQTVSLDSMGHFSIPIVATDDTDTLPTGGSYSVTITFDDQSKWQFQIIAPHASGGGIVDISDYVVLQPAGGAQAFVPLATVGQDGGPAGPLDSHGLIPVGQLPSTLPVNPAWKYIAKMPGGGPDPSTDGNWYDEAAACYLGGYIWQFGGCGNGDDATYMGCDSAWVMRYNPVTDTWTKMTDYPPGTIENALAVAIDSTHIALIGGDGVGSQGSNSQLGNPGYGVHVYDITNDTWSAGKADAPFEIDDNCGFCFFGGQVLVVKKDGTDVQQWDPVGNAWSHWGNLPTIYNGPALVTLGSVGLAVLGGTLVLFGGLDFSAGVDRIARVSYLHQWTGSAWAAISGSWPFAFKVTYMNTCVVPASGPGGEDVLWVVAPTIATPGAPNSSPNAVMTMYLETGTGNLKINFFAAIPEWFEDYTAAVSDGTDVYVFGGYTSAAVKTDFTARRLRFEDLIEFGEQNKAGFLYRKPQHSVSGRPFGLTASWAIRQLLEAGNNEMLAYLGIDLALTGSVQPIDWGGSYSYFETAGNPLGGWFGSWPQATLNVSEDGLYAVELDLLLDGTGTEDGDVQIGLAFTVNDPGNPWNNGATRKQINMPVRPTAHVANDPMYNLHWSKVMYLWASDLIAFTALANLAAGTVTLKANSTFTLVRIA